MPFLTLLWSNQWLRSLLLVLVVSLSTGLYGYRKGVVTTDQKWQAVQTQVLENQLKEVDRLQKLNVEVVAKYEAEKAKSGTYYTRWKNEVAKVTDGRVCFTPDAYRVWISALGGKGDLPPAPGKPNDSTPGASDATILNYSIDNFKQYTDCRNQVKAIIEWRDKSFGK